MTSLGSSPDNTETEISLSKPADSGAKLTGVLYELATTTNPKAIAKRQGVEYKNGDVKVLIELRPNSTLPEGYGIQPVSTANTDIIAWVPVSHLIAVSEHSNVTYIRRPPEVQQY